MTGAGHCLTGMSIGVLSLPPRWSTGARLLGMLVFGALAYVPDIKLFSRYDVRHSLLVNASMMIVPVLALTLWRCLRERVGGWRTICGGCSAWLSHLLLDSFYNHGLGVKVGWPFGPLRLNFAIPFFASSRPEEGLSLHNLRVVSVELAFYGVLLVLCLWITCRLKRRAARIAPILAEQQDSPAGG